jgi:ABC-2 type transport system ATP-binding protein
MTTTQQAGRFLTVRHENRVQAELLGASKHFGSGLTRVPAVQGLDLEVHAGEVLAILGPNGAGKSTAIGMLTGLTTPTSGTARLFGHDPRDVQARRHLGVMLQASGVPETLRVRELLIEFCGYYPAPLPLAQVVTAAGLDGLEGRRFGDLSGGQQRRVLFGIALAGDPDLLVFDEPTTGLDVETRRGLWATVRDLARSGRGVVLTTHYLEEADALADRIVVIDRGVVIAQGSPAEIKALVPGRQVRARTSVSLATASRWPGVVRASREGPWLELLAGSAEPVLRALLDLDPFATEVTVTEASLEEAFLALTSHMEAAP